MLGSLLVSCIIMLVLNKEKDRTMVAEVRRLQEERKKRRSAPSNKDKEDLGFYFEDLFPEGFDECDISSDEEAEKELLRKWKRDAENTAHAKSVK